MTSKLIDLAPEKGKPAWSFAQKHMDHLVKDFAKQCNFYSKEDKNLWIHNANKILTLSPDNPYAMSLLIEVDWENVRARLAGWEKKGMDFPPFVGALGRRYSELREYDKARELLERYIRESPEYWAYERLARNYKAQGDIEHWLATLDQYLVAGDDHGLDQAKVRVAIANYHMKNRNFEKAQPYAEAAAETWAGWAMQCAVYCYEGLKDWERAELWVQRFSERYPNTSLHEWLNFCKRTGHGDIKAAQALVEQYEAAFDNVGRAAVVVEGIERDDPLEAGFSSWLKGSTEEAMGHFRKAYEADHPLLAGFSLVALADELGDSTRRDAIMEELGTKHKSKAPKMIEVLQMFRDPLSRGDRATPDLKAVDLGIESTKPNVRGNTEFYVGWLLRKHGNRQDAETYLERCIESPYTNGWLKRIANADLRRTNHDTVPAKDDLPAPK